MLKFFKSHFMQSPAARTKERNLEQEKEKESEILGGPAERQSKGGPSTHTHVKPAPAPPSLFVRLWPISTLAKIGVSFVWLVSVLRPEKIGNVVRRMGDENPERVGPEGWGPEGWEEGANPEKREPQGWGPEGWETQTFRAFFLALPLQISVFCSSFGGLLVELWPC